MYNVQLNICDYPNERSQNGVKARDQRGNVRCSLEVGRTPSQALPLAM